MEIEVLAYKIHKGTVLVEDYITWAHASLFNDVTSPSLNILAAVSPQHNIFEVESYFKKALQEMQLQLPGMDTSIRGYIAFLALEILQEQNESKWFQLAQEIFKLVIELQYPEDLMEWYIISEMRDQLLYDSEYVSFTTEQFFQKIKIEAEKLVGSTK